ncbi:hypothetical protein FACS189419_01670 [Planctomycetales bacterium]|nr:hypothetical protein FACS189419_01670 [Planctomycetales bacterium]
MIFRVDRYEPLIYTTGAFLRPMKVFDCDGKEMWLWAVTGFDGADSFNDGNVCNPIEVANTKEKLLVDSIVDE